MQLCSCLATVALGEHEHTAAIPTLFLILEALSYKHYFFFVTKPDSSQHFFKLLPSPFTASRSYTRKTQVFPSHSSPLRSATLEAEMLEEDPFTLFFLLPYRNQRENTSLRFPAGLPSVLKLGCLISLLSIPYNYLLRMHA